MTSSFATAISRQLIRGTAVKTEWSWCNDRADEDEDEDIRKNGIEDHHHS